MQITEIRVYPRNEEKLKAFITVTFDDAFVVRNLKVIQTKENLFVAMPSRKMADGTHKDIAHPINNETRKHIEEKVLAAYKQKISEEGVEKKSAPEQKISEENVEKKPAPEQKTSEEGVEKKPAPARTEFGGGETSATEAEDKVE